ncbi:MAG TPA: hypothetical protein VHA56_19950 [Mucilaginibacter sp.]|nr:hypothetical protein [Mucilaginibacter sp.]
MLRRCVSILLIIAMTAASFQRFFAYAGFELNQDYIAKVLCVNRAKPWLHCDGKCYFMRKMKEVQQREAGNEREAQKNATHDVYVLNSNRVIFYSHLLRIVDTPYPLNLTDGCVIRLFRPPKPVS